MNTSSAIRVDKLTKHFQSGGSRLTVLNGVSLSIAAGSVCAVVGPSGSGKTTLLGLCAGLDRPDGGTIEVSGRDLTRMTEEELAAFRRANLGFVFQSFRLLPTLTALENVMVPLELLGRDDARAQATELLARVGLAERTHHLPSQLSGGEQQRVGLARAFVHRPSVLFADEPTGNLDAETGALITDLLFSLNRDAGTTCVIVTHNPELAERADRVISLAGGALSEDRPGRGARPRT